VTGPAFRFSLVSTRNFMLDRSVFDRRSIVLERIRPGVRMLLAAAAKRALLRGDPRFAPAERSLTHAMITNGLTRVDFLGRSPGMWGIHPPMRSGAFHDALPALIRRIEEGDVPEGQRGDYDLNSSMLDVVA
jgi:hypothetical protein